MHDCNIGLNDILHIAADNTRIEYKQIKDRFYGNLGEDNEEFDLTSEFMGKRKRQILQHN